MVRKHHHAIIIQDKAVTDALAKLHHLFLECLQESNDQHDFYAMARAMKGANTCDPHCTEEIVQDAHAKLSIVLANIRSRKKS